MDFILIFLIVITLIAIIDISALSHGFVFMLLMRFVLKKFNLYGDEIDYSRDMEDLDSYIGSTAQAHGNFKESDNGFHGHVILNGVKWEAHFEKEQIEKDDVVIVTDQDGLLLSIRKK